MASFDEMLIAIYETYPCLYDKKVKSYKDTTLKANVWESISRELNCEVEVCQSRMKLLRERYCREKKAISDARSGSKAITKEPWPLFNMLSFLNDHIKPRQTYNNFDLGLTQRTEAAKSAEVTQCSFLPDESLAFKVEVVDSTVEDESSNFVSVFHSELEGRSSDTVIQEALASGSGHHSQQIPRGKRKAQHQNTMHEAVNRFTESYESRNLPRHGDAAFAEYITAELASLPEDIKDTAVMNIMKVLMDAKREKRSRFD